MHDHAQGVGQLDPVERVHVDRQVPLAYLAGHDAGQQGEIAGDHQPLDVMGIGMFQALADRLAHAVHLRLARPVELRQRAAVAECIASGIVGHLQPVHAAYVLPPANQLADKPFASVQPDAARPIGRLHIATQLAQVQQADVQCCADTGVKQERLVAGHGVLVVAEPRQAIVQKVVPEGLRVGVGHGVIEGVEGTVVAAEVFTYQRQHVLGDRVRAEARRVGRLGALGQCLAVVRIKVPGTAHWRTVTVEQEPALAAHLPVEVLHAQLFFTAGPSRELVTAAQESVVGMPLDRQTAVLQGLLKAPVTAFGQVYFPGLHQRLPAP
eukprot:gene21081-biopygen11802